MAKQLVTGSETSLSLILPTGLESNFPQVRLVPCSRARRHGGHVSGKGGPLAGGGDCCRFWNQTGVGLSPSLQCWHVSIFSELQPLLWKTAATLATASAHVAVLRVRATASEHTSSVPCLSEVLRMACYFTWFQRISC